MKKQTLSILLALVLLLSISIFPVFAQEISEEEISGYFGVIEDWDMQDLALAGVDAEAVDMTEFEAKSVEAPEALIAEEVVVGGEQELAAKAYAVKTATSEGKYVSCGDGKFKVKITITEDKTIPAADMGTPGFIFIDKVTISNINGVADSFELKDCKSSMGETCEKVAFVGGKTVIEGYVSAPFIIDAASVTYDVSIDWKKEAGDVFEGPITVIGATATETDNLCPVNNLIQVAEKGVYEQCGGKASFKVDLEVPADGPDCLVPAQIYIEGEEYVDYTCRYTRFGKEGYPFGGDYCTPGQPIKVKAGEKIRFEAIIDDLTNPIADTMSGDPLAIDWRFGYNGAMISGVLDSVKGPAELCNAKIVPLKPLPTMKDADVAIKPSGWYGTYDKAAVGLYQKCGKYASLQIRLRNDGAKVGYIQLPGAIAINGGTPISSYWLSSIEPDKDKKIALVPGQVVTLVSRIWMTNVISQTNSDAAITGAVNFPELGLYLTGPLASDKVNWRCY